METGMETDQLEAADSEAEHCVRHLVGRNNPMAVRPHETI